MDVYFTHLIGIPKQLNIMVSHSPRRIPPAPAPGEGEYGRGETFRPCNGTVPVKIHSKDERPHVEMCTVYTPQVRTLAKQVTTPANLNYILIFE